MATKEVKRGKFVRLAESRTVKAINAIRVIGNLSNRGNYSYEAADVEQIFGALQKELDECRERFAVAPAAEDVQPVFKLASVAPAPAEPAPAEPAPAELGTAEFGPAE